MKTIIVALGMLFCCVAPMFAQQPITGKITLTITDNNGKPLPFTSVILRKVKDSSLVKGEMSAENGGCAFQQVSHGHYFIQASQVGYTTTYTKPFQVDAAHKVIALGNVLLPPLGKNLQAVNVTAQKPLIETAAGKTVMNIENSVSAAGNTALDLLRRAPGVQVDNNENVTLKGQSVTVMIDGKQTYLSGEQLTNLLKTTPGESIATIEILTSPSAKYDAAGNGGIINIKTKKGKLKVSTVPSALRLPSLNTVAMAYQGILTGEPKSLTSLATLTRATIPGWLPANMTGCSGKPMAALPPLTRASSSATALKITT